MTYYDQNALKLCHAFWRERLRPGMTCVDATAGRGRDAEVLCRLIGETGHLYAFDIQADAIESTRQRLTEARANGSGDADPRKPPQNGGVCTGSGCGGF